MCKANVYHDISIRMLRIFHCTIVKPFLIIFSRSRQSCFYTDLLKISRVTPVHEKINKQIVSNYGPISFTNGKRFGKLIYNSL